MPIFTAPKKKGAVRFITDYHRINIKLERKPQPLPRTSKTMK